jgi:hypothetical protein
VTLRPNLNGRGFVALILVFLALVLLTVGLLN